MIKNILLAFIPIFVAVDAVGVLPIFVNITQGFKKEDRKKIEALTLHVLGKPATRIGLVVKERGLWLQAGNMKTQLPLGGYAHF